MKTELLTARHNFTAPGGHFCEDLSLMDIGLYAVELTAIFIFVNSERVNQNNSIDSNISKKLFSKNIYMNSILFY
jgi:hypothetical protein